MSNLHIVNDIEAAVVETACDWSEVENRQLEAGIVARAGDGQTVVVGRIHWEKCSLSDIAAAAQEAWAEAPGSGSGPEDSPGYRLKFDLAHEQIPVDVRGVEIQINGQSVCADCDPGENVLRIVGCESSGVCLRFMLQEQEILDIPIVNPRDYLDTDDDDEYERQYRAFHAEEM